MAFTYTMELHVEAAGVANWLPLGIAAPQCGGGCLAVGTGEAHPAGSGLQHREESLGSCFCRAGLPE